jgi:hypothetical protein
MYAFGADSGIAGGTTSRVTNFGTFLMSSVPPGIGAAGAFILPVLSKANTVSAVLPAYARKYRRVHPHRLLSRWQVIRVALNVERREIQSC